MITSKLIEKINLYIDCEISLQDFEDWYLNQLPLLLALPPSDLTDLVAAIELGLAEIGSGILSEDNFRHSLRDAILNLTIWLNYPDIQMPTSTGTQDAPYTPIISHDFATSDVLFPPALL